MTEIGNNNPPYSVLNLSKTEHEFLEKLFKRGEEQSYKIFKEICSMSSDDPRATHRASLSFAASMDKSMFEHFKEKLEDSIE